MRIRNATRGTELADKAWAARGFWPRLVGLLGRSGLAQGEALLLEPCSSVHTAFMRFPIDVIYLDREAKVVKVAPRMKPFRMGGVLRGARSVIELPAGVIERTGTARGDEVQIED
jgi:hypothetical protein